MSLTPLPQLPMVGWEGLTPNAPPPQTIYYLSVLATGLYRLYESMPNDSLYENISFRQNRAICPPSERLRGEGSVCTRSVAPLGMQYIRHYACTANPIIFTSVDVGSSLVRGTT